MNAHTLSREEIEEYRREWYTGDPEDEENIKAGVLCDMALECLETRLKAFTRTEVGEKRDADLNRT